MFNFSGFDFSQIKPLTPPAPKTPPGFLTVTLHAEQIERAILSNLVCGWSETGASFTAFRSGVYKILRAEEEGQPQVETDPVRSAHRERVQTFMAKLHNCSDAKAGKLAREWLRWTSEQLELPVDEWLAEQMAPGVPAAYRPLKPMTLEEYAVQRFGGSSAETTPTVQKRTRTPEEIAAHHAKVEAERKAREERRLKQEEEEALRLAQKAERERMMEEAIRKQRAEEKAAKTAEPKGKAKNKGKKASRDSSARAAA